MAHENSNSPEKELKAHELAQRLDEIFFEEVPMADLEKAIRYMSVNGRERLKRALATAETNM